MFGRRQCGKVVPLAAERFVRRAAPGPAREDSTVAYIEIPSATPGDSKEWSRDELMMALLQRAKKAARLKIDPGEGMEMPRAELAAKLETIIDELTEDGQYGLSGMDRRDMVTALLNEFLLDTGNAHPGAAGDPGRAAGADKKAAALAASRDSVERAKEKVQPLLMERVDVSTASELPRAEFAGQIGEIVSDILGEEKIRLNLLEQRHLVTMLLNDMLGLGPLEPLLADETITDILVNGPKRVYVERGGKMELTDVAFRDHAHVMNVATRIVTRIGRRVDESSPLVDARLEDGSRVNIIIPPLAIKGPSISIRKFAKKKITLDVMERQKNLSAAMAMVLKIAARCRLNILISGGTGSGKTTLLNAMSRLIDNTERIVTIEDAAELQLQQPHVVPLETRPANLEGDGEITQRDLVKNALRMRPDRIILGEVRSGEALDMLQAMNTGHDGSMSTIHANRPREALTRLENMVAMAGFKLPNVAVRAQIAGAINMIVQVSRMRDGIRRITQITEVVGMEGDIITTQDLFNFEFEREDQDGTLQGAFKPTGLRPHFLARAKYFGLERALMEVISPKAEGG